MDSSKFGSTPWRISLTPCTQTPISVRLSLKAPEASPSSPRRVRLESFYHHLPLSLVLPEVAEGLFLLGIVLSYPLRAALDEGFYVELGSTLIIVGNLDTIWLVLG